MKIDEMRKGQIGYYGIRKRFADHPEEYPSGQFIVIPPAPIVQYIEDGIEFKEG